MKKGILENFAKFTGKYLWFTKFSGTPFLQNTPATATLRKWGTANSVWKTSDEYSLYLETLILEVPFRCIILSQQHKLSVCVFIGSHSLMPEAATRLEVFCKKGCS